MKKHKLRRRAYRQGVTDHADRSIPVYLAQIAEARQEAQEARDRAGDAEKRVKTLETFVQHLVEASGAPCPELLWDTVSKTAKRILTLAAEREGLRTRVAELIAVRDQLRAALPAEAPTMQERAEAAEAAESERDRLTGELNQIAADLGVPSKGGVFARIEELLNAEQERDQLQGEASTPVVVYWRKRAEAAEKCVAEMHMEVTAAIRERDVAQERARQSDADRVHLRASNARLVAERDQLKAANVNMAHNLNLWTPILDTLLEKLNIDSYGGIVPTVDRLMVERDRLKKQWALSDATLDRVTEERDRLQATIDRARAAGWCDTDDVARGLQGEDEAGPWVRLSAVVEYLVAEQGLRLGLKQIPPLPDPTGRSCGLCPRCNRDFDSACVCEHNRIVAWLEGLEKRLGGGDPADEQAERDAALGRLVRGMPANCRLHRWGRYPGGGFQCYAGERATLGYDTPEEALRVAYKWSGITLPQAGEPVTTTLAGETAEQGAKP